MRLYAESSAVLAWLLGEERGEPVRRLLAEAESIVTSDLTLVECDRVLVRALHHGQIAEAVAADLRATLNAAALHWYRLRIADEIVERACRPFPGEPVRTLDALHLASALTARAAATGTAVLSLDDRIRLAARALGMEVVPP